MADTNKMLIDATHPEETRVVVLRGGRVEEFDYESAARKQLRGNIYLAKVTRVEPSLQAAFVDYGGNRHGFLAFNEIHPDYYQIPVADRQALIEEEAAAEAAEEAAAEARADARARREAARAAAKAARQKSAGGDHDSELDDGDGEDDDAHEITDLQNDGPTGPSHDEDEAEDADASAAAGETEAPRTHAESTGLASERLTAEPEQATEIQGEPPQAAVSTPADTEPTAEAVVAVVAIGSAEEAPQSELDMEAPRPHGLVEDEGVHDVEPEATNGEAEESVEQVGSEDALEELPSRPRRRPRSYKIQEVIKRRQVVLVQVVKEERGNKGAALTTYLSLAGRYTVLMPNTARGGGISRKITQPQDRKRLKAIAAELDVPEGMGLIIRTAGAARTKQEIKRDFEYLLRLWESVRELTLQSTAPSLVYEEGNLIKRSIRDLYNKDVDEIIVAGAEAHHEAREFMRMLMPSHAKNVINYQQPEPLFTRFQIERQLNAMFSPYVTLRSGGYLVINQTEALVAIDVNSGKATREFSIEETALVTNCEAADEIARQLKLRDLAGLIVIDFIDMEEKRTNRTVERRMKEALRHDRARIQVGRISHFGLLEMSRQRLRTGVLEGSTSQCPHCQGTGIIRSVESVALAVLRGLEDAVMAGSRTALTAVTTPTVALYILNKKRSFIIDMETRHGLPILVEGSDKMQGANYAIEKGPASATLHRRPEKTAVNMDWGFGEDDDETAIDTDAEETEEDNEARGHHHERSDRNERHESGERSGRGERGERAARSEREDRGERAEAGDRDDGDGRRRRRRRRRGRRDERDERHEAGASDFEGRDEEVIETVGGEGEHDDDDVDATGDASEAAAGSESATANGEGQRRRRRRGRRGGRRNRERMAGGEPSLHDAATGDNEAGDGDDMNDDDAMNGHDGSESQPMPMERTPTQASGEASVSAHADAPAERHSEPIASTQRIAVSPRPEQPTEAAAIPDARDAPAMEPAEERVLENTRTTSSRGEQTASQPKFEHIVSSPGETASISPEDEASSPTRKGWWQRRFGS